MITAFKMVFSVCVYCMWVKSSPYKRAPTEGGSSLSCQWVCRITQHTKRWFLSVCVHLRNVGEETCCLPVRGTVAAPPLCIATPLLRLSISETPFSRSVWLASRLAEPLALAMLIEFFPWEVTESTAASMLLVEERFPLRAAAPERLGLGRLRYCRVERALIGRKPSSWCPNTVPPSCPPAFNPPDSERAPDLGIFPSVAEPLVMVAPLAVTIVTIPWPCFLKPKVLVGVREVSACVCVWGSETVFVSVCVVGVRLVGIVCFLASSPLLRPASEGERWRPLERGERRPFSDTLTSSVLPAGHRMRHQKHRLSNSDLTSHFSQYSDTCIYKMWQFVLMSKSLFVTLDFNDLFFLLSVLDDHVTWTVGLVAHWTSGACATSAFSPGWRHPHLSAHASPPRASVGHGGSLSSWATLVWLIRNVGGVPTTPPGTCFHPNPAVWTSVWPLDLVSRPSLVCRCWGWVLLCISYRLGRHTKIVRFTAVVENVALKSPLLWPKPSYWLKLPAFTPSSPPVQLSENIWA